MQLPRPWKARSNHQGYSGNNCRVFERHIGRCTQRRLFWNLNGRLPSAKQRAWRPQKLQVTYTHGFGCSTCCHDVWCVSLLPDKDPRSGYWSVTSFRSCSKPLLRLMIGFVLQNNFVAPFVAGTRGWVETCREPISLNHELNFAIGRTSQKNTYYPARGSCQRLFARTCGTRMLNINLQRAWKRKRSTSQN